MKDLVIIGAGGFGREVAALVERINKVEETWNLLGFLDDNKDLINQTIEGYKILGSAEWLHSCTHNVYVVCSLGDSSSRRKIVEMIQENNYVKFAKLIDPSAIVMKNVDIGEGSIICAGTVITINVNIGKHSIVNLNCTIGHDSLLGDFFTAHPGTNISGRVFFGQECLCGTGTKVIQGIKVVDRCIFGAGSVLVSDASLPGLYVGVPAKLIKN